MDNAYWERQRRTNRFLKGRPMILLLAAWACLWLMLLGTSSVVAASMLIAMWDRR